MGWESEEPRFVYDWGAWSAPKILLSSKFDSKFCLVKLFNDKRDDCCEKLPLPEDNSFNPVSTVLIWFTKEELSESLPLTLWLDRFV